MKISTLSQDLEATNACNEFRNKRGLCNAKNPYSWWKYLFCALCYYHNNGATVQQMIKDLDGVGIKNISPSVSGLLKKVSNQEKPSEIRREYTRNLPTTARRLRFRHVGSFKKPGEKGRSADLYVFADPITARRDLERNFPEMIHLFNLLDRHLSLNN